MANIDSSGVPRSLNSWKIAGLILAFLTPIAVTTGTFPLLFAFGGPTAAWMFLAGAVVELFFLYGYARMAQRIHRPGGFFAYIARGLGKPFGVGAGMVAVVGYVSGLVAIFAVQPFLFQQVLATLGVTLDWKICSILMLVIVGALSWRNIDLSAKLVGATVVCEFTLLIALIISIAVHKGGQAFSGAVFAPSVFHHGQWTVAFVLAFLCFQGFETGALYAPEAKNPAKDVPRGLYLALGTATVIFTLVTWVLISITGVSDLQAKLMSGNPSAFVFNVAQAYLGTAGLKVFSIFVVIASLASTLTFTNFTSRYIQSLSAERLLPAIIARKNKHHVPGVAVIALLVIVVLIDLGLGSIGLDPYTQISPVGFGLSVTAITVILMLASASVVLFFRGDAARGEDWRIRVVPVIATLLLAVALVIELRSFSYVTGSTDAWLSYLPLAVVLALVGGVGFALWLRANRPTAYAEIALGDSAEEVAAIHARRDADARSLQPAQENAAPPDVIAGS